MKSYQKKYWLHQISAFFPACFIAFFLFPRPVNLPVFYFPSLTCGVAFCTSEDNFLPFLGQYFLLTILCLYVVFFFTLEKFFQKNRQILQQKMYKPWVLGMVILILLSAAWECGAKVKSFLHNDFPIINEPCFFHYKTNYPYIYQFAEKVKTYFPEGYQEARLITDIDFLNSKNMFSHRAISYFLYPINIRFHSPEQNPKILLFFSKKNALDYVPPGYNVLATFNSYDLIAVKK